MLKLLIWTYNWLAKCARTLDIWGCNKSVVDNETSARSIVIGQNLLFVISVALIATAFYLCMRGCDILCFCCLAIWFAGFVVLWKKGEKITVTIDKTLKAEEPDKIYLDLFSDVSLHVESDVSWFDGDTSNLSYESLADDATYNLSFTVEDELFVEKPTYYVADFDGDTSLVVAVDLVNDDNPCVSVSDLI